MSIPRYYTKPPPRAFSAFLAYVHPANFDNIPQETEASDFDSIHQQGSSTLFELCNNGTLYYRIEWLDDSERPYVNLLRVETTQQKDNKGIPTGKEQEEAMILNLEMVRQGFNTVDDEDTPQQFRNICLLHSSD